jgi:hypothetical protein
MVFNIISKVVSDPEREERQLFASVPAADISACYGIADEQARIVDQAMGGLLGY